MMLTLLDSWLLWPTFNTFIIHLGLHCYQSHVSHIYNLIIEKKVKNSLEFQNLHFQLTQSVAMNICFPVNDMFMRKVYRTVEYYYAVQCLRFP